jgi:ribosomal protein L37AE/L43A
MTAAERRAQQIRRAAALAETEAVVARGKCPQCGSGLRRNLALSGWWQCEQYGATSYRARPDDPSCSWQGFTE